MTEEQTEKDIFIALIKADNEIYIMVSDKNVQAFETLKKAIGFFENTYKEKHLGNYESSISACINWLQYNPSIIKVANQEELTSIATNPPVDVQLRSVSGAMVGFKTRKDVSENLWDKGIKPDLIKNEFFE
jgi:hypothetical protein